MLSKKKKSITGARVANLDGASIKPSKARKIIRRYHVLIASRKSLCDALGIELCASDEHSNMERIKSQLTGSDLACFSDGLHAGASDACDAHKSRDNHDPNPARDRARDLRRLAAIMAELHTAGGLAKYQMASRNGQATDRGGDSSKRLVRWLAELGLERNAAASAAALEIGSLSCRNAISTCGLFASVVRIDLNNTNDTRGILKQDFMDRPLPRDNADRFSVVSCSLVLNFVPTPAERGAMLRRIPLFLRPGGYLFLVLPRPCIDNSRYMTGTRFLAILETQGFSLVRDHQSSKLCYFLFVLQPQKDQSPRTFPKEKLLDGPAMNNFSIVI